MKNFLLGIGFIIVSVLTIIVSMAANHGLEQKVVDGQSVFVCIIFACMGCITLFIIGAAVDKEV